MAKPTAFYNGEFLNDPSAFMNKYSCSPAGDGGDTGVAQAAFHNDYNHHLMGNKIAWLDFEKKHQVKQTDITPTGAGAFLRLSDPAGFIDVIPSYVQDPAKVEAYFLPWTYNGVIRLDIPANLGPNVFFTAAVTGCSVIIKGTPQAPIVFHAGGSTNTNTPDEGAQFWRDLIESHTDIDDAALGQSIGEVNKTSYIVDKVKRVSESTLNGKTGKMVKRYKNVQKGTANSRKFDEWLKKKSGPFVVENVEPFGCVMGMRQPGGDWWFYVQENARITYSTVTSSYLGLKKTKLAGSERTTSRPINFTRFYPGAAHVKFKPALSRVLT